MKYYAYTYERLNNDKNGNPRHFVVIYRVKRNQLERIHEQPKIDVGYRDPRQAVCETISEVENLKFSDKEVADMGNAFKHFYQGRRNHACMTSGASYDPASWRERQGKISVTRI